jgi:hypothetical protein
MLSSSNDQQNDPRHDIENINNDLVGSQERVEHHIEGLSLHGKPSAVPSENEISGEHPDKERQHQEADIYDRTPH